MSGYVPYGPDSCSAQNIGSGSGNTDYTSQRQLTGHRRQRPGLVGYKFSEHKLEDELERGSEQVSRRELLKNAGPDDGPYPWFTRPVPRIDYWAESNVDRWDPYHPEYAGNDENRRLPSIELPPAVSPISSFQLLGMTGPVAPSQDSQEASSLQGPDTRASSAANLPVLESRQTSSRTRANADVYNDYFRTRDRDRDRDRDRERCCFFFRLSHKKAMWAIYSSIFILIVSIAVSAVIYDGIKTEGSFKTAAAFWIGGNVLFLVVMLVYNNARAGRLQERGPSSGQDKGWEELSRTVGGLRAPNPVQVHGNGVVYRAHAGGQLSSLTNVKATSESKSKAKSKATRGSCMSGFLGSSRSSAEPPNSVRSGSTQCSDADSVGIARSDSLQREEEMAKAMKDRHDMLREQEAQDAHEADASTTPAADSDSGGSVEKTLSVTQQGSASMSILNLPESCLPTNKSEQGFGSGLPPRDTWCREPCGSMSNLRADYYGNEDPGPSSVAPSKVANGGMIPKHTSSLAARCSELTPIAERSYEGLSPRSLLLSSHDSIQTPSRSRGAVPSSSPSADTPYVNSDLS
ncbi:hypothetical protein F4805DRAFT_461870 [Annulohypoxylon moriforme]|nr:hypothetical protein F4805DRAFT_461870 [Annulohypoxylon moriforme]